MRACLCDLGRGAHPFELGGAVGELRFECRLRAGRRVGCGADLRLERAGGWPRGARAGFGLVAVGDRLVTVGNRRVALGAGLVALGPQTAMSDSAAERRSRSLCRRRSSSEIASRRASARRSASTSRDGPGSSAAGAR